ncbi:MAG: hypothetical protein AAFY11_01235 [Cyanobacteria bacterium J06641_5]
MFGGLLLAIAIAIILVLVALRPHKRQQRGNPDARFFQEYQYAQRAYLEGDYPEAARSIERLLVQRPDAPSVVLLRAHLHYCLQEYDLARTQYGRVLELTADLELLEYARKGIENVDRNSSSP